MKMFEARVTDNSYKYGYLIKIEQNKEFFKDTAI